MRNIFSERIGWLKPGKDSGESIAIALMPERPVTFTSEMNHSRRLRALRRSMNDQGVEALIVTHLPDVRYLCGFTGSNAALCVSATRAALFTDGRYIVQAKEQTQSARVVISEVSALGDACAWLERCGAKRAYFDPDHVTVAMLREDAGVD